MSAKKWHGLPRAAPHFDFAGDELHRQWPRLHAGDCEPFPKASEVADAWRAFHAGDFQRAWRALDEVGENAFAPALKAVGVYASAVESSDKQAQTLLLEAAERAGEIAERAPRAANAHYLHAFTLGRYSQRISIMEALAQGYAGKIERSLKQALKLEPRHADAHLALGLYHAEIIGKLGSLAAGLTYGASAEVALEHFRKALKLNPSAPSTPLEYAHGLQLIESRRRAAEIDELLDQASRCEPHDAMEWLDRERAARLRKAR